LKVGVKVTSYFLHLEGKFLQSLLSSSLVLSVFVSRGFQFQLKLIFVVYTLKRT
jgi:hypothetical protein